MTSTHTGHVKGDLVCDFGGRDGSRCSDNLPAGTWAVCLATALEVPM